MRNSIVRQRCLQLGYEPVIGCQIHHDVNLMTWISLLNFPLFFRYRKNGSLALLLPLPISTNSSMPTIFFFTLSENGGMVGPD